MGYNVNVDLCIYMVDCFEDKNKEIAKLVLDSYYLLVSYLRIMDTRKTKLIYSSQY
jgi:hypothetical protein